MKNKQKTNPANKTHTVTTKAFYPWTVEAASSALPSDNDILKTRVSYPWGYPLWKWL